MSDEYDIKIAQKMYEAKCIMEGLEDLKNGRVFDGEETIKSIMEKYDLKNKESSDYSECAQETGIL